MKTSFLLQKCYKSKYLQADSIITNGWNQVLSTKKHSQPGFYHKWGGVIKALLTNLVKME